MADWNPKTYRDNGETITWGDNLSDDRMARLRNGEVFTLLNSDGIPAYRILMDSFDQIRQGAIDNPDEGLARAFFGVPVSPYVPEHAIGVAAEDIKAGQCVVIDDNGYIKRAATA